MTDTDSATNTCTYTLEFDSEPATLFARLDELARDHSECGFELTVTPLDGPSSASNGKCVGHPYRDAHAADQPIRARMRARAAAAADNVAEAELTFARDGGKTVLSVEYLPCPSPKTSEGDDCGYKARDLWPIVIGAGLGTSSLFGALVLTLVTLVTAHSYSANELIGILGCFGFGALMLFATWVRLQLETIRIWLRGYSAGLSLDYGRMWEMSPGVKIHRVLDHLRLVELRADEVPSETSLSGCEFARGVKAARFAARAIAENAAL